MNTLKSVMIFLLLFCVLHDVTGEKYVVGSGKETAKENSQAAKKKNINKNDTLIITARIIEIPGKFVVSDIYLYVYVMKYRVIKVEQGNYTEKEILVGQYNPHIPRNKIKDSKDTMNVYVDGDAEKFEEGDKHRLVLITPIEKVWNNKPVEDEYIDSEQEKYFALKTDTIK